jgi:multicomponent Na+:H+ antiporter subunit D
MAPASKRSTSYNAASRIQEVAALALALCSLLLGLVPWEVYLPIPHGVASDKLGFGALSKTLVPLLGGAMVAILLGRWEFPLEHPSRWRGFLEPVGRVRRSALALSDLIGRCDDVLRQWPTACICLLSLAVLFAASMLASS